MKLKNMIILLILCGKTSNHNGVSIKLHEIHLRVLVSHEVTLSKLYHLHMCVINNNLKRKILRMLIKHNIINKNMNDVI